MRLTSSKQNGRRFASVDWRALRLARSNKSEPAPPAHGEGHLWRSALHPSHFANRRIGTSRMKPAMRREILATGLLLQSGYASFRAFTQARPAKPGSSSLMTSMEEGHLCTRAQDKTTIHQWVAHR
jgi:hypothetical protein